MAETTTDDGSTSDGSGSSGGFIDRIVSFVTKPLGMGLVAGVAIAGYLAWRVF